MQAVAQNSTSRSMHPFKALAALIRVARNPEDTATGALMIDHLSGNSQQRYFERFAQHPMGAQILAEGRRLDRTLADRDALAALPRESLGRHYFEWTRARNLSAEGLLEATASVSFGAVAGDAAAELVSVRGKVAHDLWHVVTGYDSDLLGESALLHLILIQTRNTGLILPCWLGLLTPSFSKAGRRLIWQARSRARRAKWLVATDWESMLERPIDEVREELRLGAPPDYERVWETPFR